MDDAQRNEVSRVQVYVVKNYEKMGIQFVEYAHGADQYLWARESVDGQLFYTSIWRPGASNHSTGSPPVSGLVGVFAQALGETIGQGLIESRTSRLAATAFANAQPIQDAVGEFGPAQVASDMLNEVMDRQDWVDVYEVSIGDLRNHSLTDLMRGIEGSDKDSVMIVWAQYGLSYDGSSIIVDMRAELYHKVLGMEKYKKYRVGQIPANNSRNRRGEDIEYKWYVEPVYRNYFSWRSARLDVPLKVEADIERLVDQAWERYPISDGMDRAQEGVRRRALARALRDARLPDWTPEQRMEVAMPIWANDNGASVKQALVEGISQLGHLFEQNLNAGSDR
jgi:hypothetical protein